MTVVRVGNLDRNGLIIARQPPVDLAASSSFKSYSSDATGVSSQESTLALAVPDVAASFITKVLVGGNEQSASVAEPLPSTPSVETNDRPLEHPLVHSPQYRSPNRHEASTVVTVGGASQSQSSSDQSRRPSSEGRLRRSSTRLRRSVSGGRRRWSRGDGGCGEGRRADTPPPQIELRRWRATTADHFDTDHLVAAAADRDDDNGYDHRRLSGRSGVSIDNDNGETILLADQLAAMLPNRRSNDDRLARGAINMMPSSSPFSPNNAAGPPSSATGWPKACCLRLSQMTLIRVFIVVISVAGLLCVTMGIVLGALTVSSGAARLTLCLLLIGVGIVLVMVSAVAWRLTALDTNADADYTSWWAPVFPSRAPPTLAHVGGQTSLPYHRIFNGHFSREPFLAGMHSEFLWRPPPPSYNASVLSGTGVVGSAVHMNREFAAVHRPPTEAPSADQTVIGSPPPTYRSSVQWRRSRLPESLQPHRTPVRPPSYSAASTDPSSSVFSVFPPTRLATSQSATQTLNSISSSQSSRCISSPPSVSPPPPPAASSSGSVNNMSVIDCSQATPVGFRVAKVTTSTEPPPPFGAACVSVFDAASLPHRELTAAGAVVPPPLFPDRGVTVTSV